MVASSKVDGVRAMVAPVLDSCGLVLEDVTIAPAGRRTVVRIVVDLPQDRAGGVTLDEIAEVSTLVSHALDGSTVLGSAPYVLEVTSPGVNRPLTEQRHWRRARGRLVTVGLSDGESRTGRLEDVDSDGILLEGDLLAWDRVASGKVEVDFSAPSDTAAQGTGEDRWTGTGEI
ncbi:MAG: ribosome maturation factor RimP [Actinomycetota bacterium]|nr:ribosome maturation factor RimP [Actinomycetota bacterium]